MLCCWGCVAVVFVVLGLMFYEFILLTDTLLVALVGRFRVVCAVIA